MEKLTPAQKRVLSWLSFGGRIKREEEAIAKALGRRGLAILESDQLGHLNSRGVWRITDTGRAAIASAEGR